MYRILTVIEDNQIRNRVKEMISLDEQSICAVASMAAAVNAAKKEKFDVILFHVTEDVDIYEFAKICNITNNPQYILTTSRVGSTQYKLDANVAAVIEPTHTSSKFISAIKSAIKNIKNHQPVAKESTQEPPAKKCKCSAPLQEKKIIGCSVAIQKLIQQIDKVAQTDARVLITGANGTGKELVANRIHLKSRRATKQFIELNCSAIPSELIESEMFGHEKGAFTNAYSQRKGKFELASGGTLFMDEIGDMSLSAQAKMLRALQEKRVTRVGGDRDIEVDTRVIAATNKCLPDEILKGCFREDLYHRLGVIVLHVPSLSERKDDIPLLIEHFISLLCKEDDIAPKSISKKAVEIMTQLPLSGNVRELRNIIERLVILSEGNTIEAKDVEQYAFY